MVSYEKKQVLVPFKRFFGRYEPNTDPRDRFPYFKVYDVSYGTQGYKYLLLAYDTKQNKWVRWPGVHTHPHIERCFRLPTQAELVLYGPF